MINSKFMQKALALARQSYYDNEVPVGCVITLDDIIVGEGRNCSEKCGNPLMHAEIVAINSACENIEYSKLVECIMYVTLEPCPMCAGAIINSKIKGLVFGAKSCNNGAVGGVLNLFYENFGHKPFVVGGIMEKECSEILSDFFKKLR